MITGTDGQVDWNTQQMSLDGRSCLFALCEEVITFHNLRTRWRRCNGL